MLAVLPMLLVGSLWIGFAGPQQEGPVESSAPSPATAAASEVTHPVPAVELAIKSGSPKESGKGSPVPEPTTLLLVGTGLVGLALSSKRWRRPPLRAGH